MQACFDGPLQYTAAEVKTKMNYANMINCDKLQWIEDVEAKINEYSQVIGSRGWEWRPKKQEFLHFIFVLTYAAVYCRGPSKQAWLNVHEKFC